MADLNVTAVGMEPSIRVGGGVTETSNAAETLKKQVEQENTRKEQTREKLEDVISVSRDGDTAQASKTSRDKLKESDESGSVKKLDDNKAAAKDEMTAAKKLLENIEEKQKTEPSAAKKLLDDIREKQKSEPSAAKKLQEEIKKETEAKKTAAARDKRDKANPTDAKKGETNKAALDSYSEDKLRQMYVNGDISRYDYDHEVEKRTRDNTVHGDEAREEKVFREGIVRAMANEEKAEISGQAVENAFDERANDNMKAEQRMAMIDAAEEMT